MTTRNTPLYQDAAQPLDARVEDLLAQMTLEEKIAQVGSHWVFELLEQQHFSESLAQQKLKNGIGQITRIGGASNALPAESAALANQIQGYLKQQTRLGIPAIVHEECCSGYMARGATLFPQAIGVASAWNPVLVERMGGVIREQMRSVGGHQALAPVLDVTRDPRWGRVEESFGEDPYLVAALGTAYVKGIQSSDLSQGVAATAKHFVGYGLSEGGRNWAPVFIPERELREVFIFPFEAAIKEGELLSIMNAYNELDGIPCAGSRALLVEVLREQLGFQGLLVSDYFSIDMLYRYHNVVPDKASAAKRALEVGMDVELPSTDCYGEPLHSALESGAISIDLLDTAVRRVLEMKFRLGIFEQPFVDEGRAAAVFDSPDQRALAHQLACESMVLLKNEGQLLPLPKTLKSLAVIGPNAHTIRNLMGDYSYPAHIETLLENQAFSMFGTPSAEGIQAVERPVEMNTILQSIQAKVSAETSVSYALGCEVLDDSTAHFAEAVAAAQSAEVAIVVVGDKAGLTDDCTSGEARDRAELNLPGVQDALVKAIIATGTPVVLVLVNGRPLALPDIVEAVPAILEAWLPGQMGADAVADVLFGDYNPGGKLAMTFPRAVGQIPLFYNHKPSGGRSHWKGDYVETSAKPLFPFGYGLSYTEFAFDNLQLSSDSMGTDGQLDICIEVENVGQRAGDEVVQLYVRYEDTSVTRPIKELKGFQRVSLAAGERRSVCFTLWASQLAFYDAEMMLVVEPGTLQLMLGSSSQAIHASGTVTISGARQVVRERVYFAESSSRALA